MMSSKNQNKAFPAAAERRTCDHTGSQTGLQVVLTLRAQPLPQSESVSFHAPSAARGREPTKTKGAQAEQRADR